MKRVTTMLCIAIGCIVSGLSAKQNCQMAPCAKMDYSGIVVSTIYYPESVTGSRNTAHPTKTSSYYEVTLKNASVLWSDPADTMCFINRTGTYTLCTLLVSPTDKVTLIRPDDQITVKGLSGHGDEFGQTYSYDDLIIQSGPTAVKQNHIRNSKISCTASYRMVNISGSDRSSYSSVNNARYYSITGRKIVPGQRQSGISIVNAR